MTRASVIEKYWYSIDWDVEAIWALDLPVSRMDVARFAWILDAPVWPFEGEGYCVTPSEVMADPRRYEVEYARVENASLAYPLDVCFHKGRWMILDGVHRLVKAILRGDLDVPVRIVPDRHLKLLK